MSENADERSDALQAAARKRVQLKHALSQVEIAAASPSGVSGWYDRLIEQLEVLQTALLEHVEEVEAGDGLLAELAERAPRLVNQINHVRDQHPGLCQQVEQALAHVRGSAPVADLRVEVLEALSAIARHRQEGADLVYEGYTVDIGGG